jgi:hypothetical protein
MSKKVEFSQLVLSDAPMRREDLKACKTLLRLIESHVIFRRAWDLD